MCGGGGSPDAPPPVEPNKLPPRRVRKQAPRRVDPAVITKRMDQQTDLRRIQAQRQSSNNNETNLGVLETTSSEPQGY